MDELQNTKNLIADLRAKRANLGDTSTPEIKRTRLPRVSSRKPSIVLLIYTFFLGTLAFPALSGEYAYFAAFVFIFVAWLYTIIRE